MVGKFLLWLSVILVSSTLQAQELPNAPSFWSKTNIALAATDGAFKIADGVATHRGMSQGSKFTETDPIARPFVTRGAAGQIAFTAGTWAFDLGVSYLLHKTGHHKLERIPLMVGIGYSGYGAAESSSSLSEAR